MVYTGNRRLKFWAHLWWLCGNLKMPFKISENISKTPVNAYNLSSQQKAIKNSSSVIYPPRRLVNFYHLWGEGVLRGSWSSHNNLYTAPHKILWDSNDPSLLADSLSVSQSPLNTLLATTETPSIFPWSQEKSTLLQIISQILKDIFKSSRNRNG